MTGGHAYIAPYIAEGTLSEVYNVVNWKHINHITYNVMIIHISSHVPFSVHMNAVLGIKKARKL